MFEPVETAFEAVEPGLENVLAHHALRQLVEAFVGPARSLHRHTAIVATNCARTRAGFATDEPLAFVRMRIAVIGTGLIGASVGLAARERGHDVAGYDPDERALAVAAERGAVDEATSVDDALDAAALAVVAAPVAQLVPTVEAVLAASADGCSVTDVGSTKARVAAAAASPRFVGGHPVCGSEAHGPAHARADLFEGASWFLTPSPQTSAETHRLVHGFVTSLGATPVAVDPNVHDRLVALTSHLPHALANLLVNQAGAARIDGHEPLAAAAGGSLRDMTRVAGANPRIWVDIFLENSGAVREALSDHRRRIEQLEQALDAGDAGFLARWIAEAGRNRGRMLAEAYPDLGTLQQLRVHVPDRPGVLAGITQALGAERINIEDFELQHVSPERGGTLRLLISGEGEAERAARLLEEQGYGVEIAPVLE